MIKKIASSVYLALSFRSYRNDNLSKSRYFVEKHLKYANKKSSTALSFRATLILLEGDMGSSRLGFIEAIRGIESKRSLDADYILLYCKYYICLIDDCPSCDELRKAALAIPASNSIKTWLSLPTEPVATRSD